MKQRELVRALLHKAAQDEAAMVRLMPDADLDDELVGFHAETKSESATGMGFQRRAAVRPESNRC